ncbi:MAG: 30S ribosomal protein S17 [Patescibacteria group bacterium]
MTTTPKRRTLKGKVVSDKMDKTVVVEIVRMKMHPKYKKFYKVSKRFKAHSALNEYHTGDHVIIEEGRPMSKEKRWTVISKVNQ